MSNVIIRNKLRVIGSDRIVVPGCEPVSAFTSKIMMAAMEKAHVCNGSVVSVKDALEAIPGSELLIDSSYTYPQNRFFVLPAGPPTVGCPCTTIEDYYAILRALPGYLLENNDDEVAVDSNCASINTYTHC